MGSSMKFIRVTSIVPAGPQHVYDLSMAKDEDPSFVANGFVVHNSYASAESSYQAFLETVNGYRSHLTNLVFYRKVFPIIGVANGLFKDGRKPKDIDPIDFLFNLGNRNKLLQPTLHWHKDLTGKTEDNMMDLLEKLTEHKVPVPLKMWLAAAGIDKDTLIRDAKEDAELHKALGIPEVKPGQEEGAEESDQVTSASVKSPFSKKPLGILNRDFGGSADAVLSKTGKPRYQPKSPGAQRDANHRIVKIAASMNDRNLQEQVRRANVAKFGTDQLRGIYK